MKTLRLAFLFCFLIGLCQESAQAGLSDALGISGGKKAAKIARKLSRGKGLSKRLGGGSVAAVVSPYTTALAQVFQSEEGLFAQIKLGFETQVLSRRQAKKNLKQLVRQAYKSVTRGERKEFRQANSGIRKHSVRKEWAAYVFNNGVIPVYF